jgi:hypothetical protein
VRQGRALRAEGGLLDLGPAQITSKVGDQAGASSPQKSRCRPCAPPMALASEKTAKTAAPR